MSHTADPTGEAARRGGLMTNSTCELASGDADVRAQAQYTLDTMIALIADRVARAKATCRATRTRPRWRGQCWPPWKDVPGPTGMDLDTLVATARSLAGNLPPDPAAD